MPISTDINQTANYGTDWRQRLALIVDMMKDMSRQTDPQAMVRAYAERVRKLIPADRRISLSRRDLTYPRYRITRSSTWNEVINPWKQKDRLPLLEGGLFAELIYGDEPRVIGDLSIGANEPAAEYLDGHRSLMALPMFDRGESLNMVLLLQREPNAFQWEQLPDMVWTGNLFGRATNTLVVKEELAEAYRLLDRELKTVGDIQRSLLPATLPKIPTMDLAAYYQPARRAGGDYYDFFPLPDGRWGIFIGDVSGHGTPAAVVMAVTHCIAHTHPGPAMPPHKVLQYLNDRLATLYARFNGTFVTAFYGIYCPTDRTFDYACAGHNPPRLKSCSDGTLVSLDGTGGLPLGVASAGEYVENRHQLQRGDQIIFYTDGVTDTPNPNGARFGTERLDRVLENCSVQASGLLDAILKSIEEFAQGAAADDDRTVIVARIS